MRRARFTLAGLWAGLLVAGCSQSSSSIPLPPSDLVETAIVARMEIDAANDTADSIAKKLHDALIGVVSNLTEPRFRHKLLDLAADGAALSAFGKTVRTDVDQNVDELSQEKWWLDLSSGGDTTIYLLNIVAVLPGPSPLRLDHEAQRARIADETVERQAPLCGARWRALGDPATHTQAGADLIDHGIESALREVMANYEALTASGTEGDQQAAAAKVLAAPLDGGCR